MHAIPSARLKPGVTLDQLPAASAAGDAFALAEAGADANASIGSNGIQGNANASARAGIGVKGDADLKSAALNIDGVDPLYAGIGTHADGFAGARVGGVAFRINKQVNKETYGYQWSADDILAGKVERPLGLGDLYQLLPPPK